MQTVRKFLGASRADRSLAVTCFRAVIAAGALVKLRPYRDLRKRLQTAPAVAEQHPRPSQPHILKVLAAVARRMPWATCLIQAIAAQNVLANYGYASTLRIGVSADAKGEFAAHAWLEQDGRVLIGGENSPTSYAVLDLSKARRSHFAGER